MTNSFDWRPLEESELLSKGEEDHAVLNTHQDIIEHDALVRFWILPNHGTFEGHGRKDVNSKVPDPSFTNLIQRSNSNEKCMLIG